jgi:hypothetical protein
VDLDFIVIPSINKTLMLGLARCASKGLAWRERLLAIHRTSGPLIESVFVRPSGIIFQTME